MTGSIIVHINSTKKYGKISHYDCCQSLGDQVMQYKGKENYSYICIIPLAFIETFFKKKENIIDYLTVIDDVFDFKSKLMDESEITLLEASVMEECPIDSHYYIEITSVKKRHNKEVVGFHNALRYTWYLHYSNIATACVNLFRLKILPDAMHIMAVASSYQTQEGRALLPSALTSTDAFIYFPTKERILFELSKGQNFNTAFMLTPIYYSPQIEIKGNFFSEDSTPTILSAKNLLSSLGSVDEINDIPSVIVNGIKQSLGDYMDARSIYDKIVDTFMANHYSSISKTILTKELIKKGELTVAGCDAMGRNIKSKINFII